MKVLHVKGTRLLHRWPLLVVMVKVIFKYNAYLFLTMNGILPPMPLLFSPVPRVFQHRPKLNQEENLERWKLELAYMPVQYYMHARHFDQCFSLVRKVLVHHIPRFPSSNVFLCHLVSWHSSVLKSPWAFSMSLNLRPEDSTYRATSRILHVAIMFDFGNCFKDIEPVWISMNQCLRRGTFRLKGLANLSNHCATSQSVSPWSIDRVMSCLSLIPIPSHHINMYQ